MRQDFAVIIDSLQSTWFQVVGFMPRFLIAAALLIIGWILARTTRWLAIRLLRFLRLEAAAERTGVEDFLVRGGVRFTIVTLIGELLYWGLLLVVAVAVLNLIGPSVGPELIRRVGAALPGVGLSLVVLLFGLLVARFVRGLVEAYLNNIGVKGTAGIGLLVHVGLVTFVVILAVEQLGMATTLLVSAFQLAFGGVCLGLALAFGLGGRRWAESVLERKRATR
jgi:hypothetical protein